MTVIPVSSLSRSDMSRLGYNLPRTVTRDHRRVLASRRRAQQSDGLSSRQRPSDEQNEVDAACMAR